MGEEIRLFRELLRAARMMPQYNIRKCAPAAGRAARPPHARTRARTPPGARRCGPRARGADARRRAAESRYCQRRIVGDFRRAAQQGAVSAEERREKLRSGREALELIRRQNIIYGMYTTDFKNLLDKQ